MKGELMIPTNKKRRKKRDELIEHYKSKWKNRKECVIVISV